MPMCASGNQTRRRRVLLSLGPAGLAGCDQGLQPGRRSVTTIEGAVYSARQGGGGFKGHLEFSLGDGLGTRDQVRLSRSWCFRMLCSVLGRELVEHWDK